MTEESQSGEGHIDLNKYKGRTPGQWSVTSIRDGSIPWNTADEELCADAPLLLAEVKRLREVINELLGAIHWDAFAEDDTTLEIGREVAERIKKTQKVVE